MHHITDLLSGNENTFKTGAFSQRSIYFSVVVQVHYVPVSTSYQINENTVYRPRTTSYNIYEYTTAFKQSKHVVIANVI